MINAFSPLVQRQITDSILLHISEYDLGAEDISDSQFTFGSTSSTMSPAPEALTLNGRLENLVLSPASPTDTTADDENSGLHRSMSLMELSTRIWDDEISAQRSTRCGNRGKTKAPLSPREPSYPVSPTGVLRVSSENNNSTTLPVGGVPYPYPTNTNTPSQSYSVSFDMHI